MPPAGPNYYKVGAWQIRQQLHRQLPPTTLYAFGPTAETASWPAPTFETVRDVPISVRWTNHLPSPSFLAYAIDPTLHMARPGHGVPMVVHLHGGATEPQSDGHPEAWFTPDFAEKGPAWKKEVYTYTNRQLPTTLWYHDHALGLTRLGMFAGLAGMYLIRDPGREPAGLPSGRYEVPLIIQDRMLNGDGSLLYPSQGLNPEHPIWMPEFFGDLVAVNGKIWPYLEVEPRKYRFRILDASNSRFYRLALAERATGAPGPAFQQIGSDGGYLESPVRLADPAESESPPLLIAPAERADVIVDFGGLKPGAELILRNTARAPFPGGDPVDPNTVGQVMLFRVVPLTSPDQSVIPEHLGPITRLSEPILTRTLDLEELEGANGPLAVLLDGAMWDDPITETPQVGTTEAWEIFNTTEDTHPIHIHLVQFQVQSRQKFDVDAFLAARHGGGGSSRAAAARASHDGSRGFRIGRPRPPDPNERGWKDTFRMNPGEVTRVIARFSPQDNRPAYAFDATAEPGYVWHCHILEHEDNEMMRPYKLSSPAPASFRASAGRLGEAQPAEGPWIAAPNPARAGAQVSFAVPGPGEAELALFGLDGGRVRTLARGTFGPGPSVATWDGRDERGAEVPAGVYFLKLRAGARNAVRRIAVVR